VSEEIEQLRSQTQAVAQSVARPEPLTPELNQLKSGLREQQQECERFFPTFPMIASESLDGIISYLTKKHGGNVHAKGIVTITSSSVVRLHCAPQNAADLTSDSAFVSKNEPGSWICWDFGETRVRPANYTIRAFYLKSWDLEGSLDGSSWTVIDRRSDTQDFKGGWVTASFPVSNQVECRFIRLTQTAERHRGNNYLGVRAVEFFGAFFE
jgi:hypothetical protein